MKNCENCETEHDGKYGSGRFCSIKCSRGFSTKAKRKEINAKVSKTLSNSGHAPIKKICEICKKDFIIKYEKRYQQTCSLQCGSKLKWLNPLYAEHMSAVMIDSYINGKRKSVHNRSIHCNYEFNGKKIRCDSKVEYAGLDYFVKTYNVLSIDRCDFSIKYQLNNKIRRYLPDFKIVTTDYIYIIECKCFFKLTAKMLKSKSWNMYYSTIKVKQKSLDEYCKINNYKSFFFTKDLHLKFYNTCNPIQI